MLTCKIIDLNQRLIKYGEVRQEEDEQMDMRWSARVLELFQDIFKTEHKIKNASRHYFKAIYPMIKYLK